MSKPHDKRSESQRKSGSEVEYTGQDPPGKEPIEPNSESGFVRTEGNKLSYNPLAIDEQILKIPVGNDIYAIIDAEDEIFTHYHWYLRKGYVVRRKNYECINLHREIAGIDPYSNLQVDHIDRDRLNNRRSNLRIVTHAQNGQNVRGFPDKTSKYRGVSYDNNRNYWRAQCKLDQECYNLGNYKNELDAARSAEAFRRKHMEFAVPNYNLDPLPSCSCNRCNWTLKL